MGIDWYVCENCNDAMSEYNMGYCTNGHSVCSCALPEEIQKQISCWEDLYELLQEDFTSYGWDKYLTNTNDYGITLKEEYCPICQREKRNKQDPEYNEYLRLKRKFEQ